MFDERRQRRRRQRRQREAIGAGELVLAQHALGRGHRALRVVGRIGDDRIELGAAERFDAAGAVDVLDRELRRIYDHFADCRIRPRQRNDDSDFHGIGRPRGIEAEDDGDRPQKRQE